MSISVVIPVHGKPELLGDALVSLNKFAGMPYELLVVDDGSPGDEAQRIAAIVDQAKGRLIRSDVNRGFSATVNLGVNNAENRLILVMNNDVRLLNGCLTSMVRRTKIGATVVGAKLLYPTYKIQHGGVFFRPDVRLFDHRFRAMHRSTRQACMVDKWLVTGALMLIDRQVFDVVGAFDEEFFVAWEDVDLCLRVFEAGHWCCYDGQAEAIHLEGATRGNTYSNKVPAWRSKEEQACKLFFKKWGGYNFNAWSWRTRYR